jgi:O-acetylserine/cysteine efflux transporter
VVGVLVSWLAFGEVLDPVELAAGALVVAGVLIGSRPAQPARVIGLTMSAMNSSADSARNTPATT